MYKCLVAALAMFSLACESGRNGAQGEVGLRGPAGASGGSCSVAQVSNGAVITCDDGTTAVVLNGQDAPTDAPTAYTVAEIIKPCPELGYREVLLKLYNGDILAHYSDGSKQFLTLITPGSYVLTDGSSCHFTVHSDMSVSW
jgi:hypothetical protein